MTFLRHLVPFCRVSICFSCVRRVCYPTHALSDPPPNMPMHPTCGNRGESANQGVRFVLGDGLPVRT